MRVVVVEWERHALDGKGLSLKIRNNLDKLKACRVAWLWPTRASRQTGNGLVQGRDSITMWTKMGEKQQAQSDEKVEGCLQFQKFLKL